MQITDKFYIKYDVSVDVFGYITKSSDISFKKGDIVVLVSQSYGQSHFSTKEEWDKMKDGRIWSSDISMDNENVDIILESLQERRKRIIKDILNGKQNK